MIVTLSQTFHVRLRLNSLSDKQVVVLHSKMGTFVGHVLPGLFFLCFGVRWSHVAIRKYLTDPSADKFSVPSQKEAWVKLVCCVIGTIGEFTQGYVGDNNVHHILMYAAFGLNAGMELMANSLPHESSRCSLLFALFVQAFISFSHTHGRNQLDTRIHGLLFFATIMSMVGVMMEMSRPQYLLSSLFKSMCFATQGSWLIQIAFILYNPFPGAVAWDPDDHVQLMNVSSLFVCHLLMHIAILFSLSLCVTRRGRRGKRVSFAGLPVDDKV